MSSTGDVLKDLFCGCMSGWGQVVTMMPFQHIKVKVVSKPLQYTSYGQCIVKTIKQEGILAFYKGMLMPLLGVGAQVSIQFGIVQTVKKHLKKHYADEQGKLGLQFSFFAGILAGLPSAALGAPLDHARFRVATTKEKGMGSLKMALNITKEHGIRKLYTGFCPTLLRDCIALSFYFGTYDGLVREFKSANDASLPVMGALFSGGMAGIAAWLFTYPIDYVKTIIQTRQLVNPQFKSARECAVAHYKKYGPRVFYTGLQIMLARAFTINSVGFLCFQVGKSIMYPKHSN